jgi:hypothetical protein
MGREKIQSTEMEKRLNKRAQVPTDIILLVAFIALLAVMAIIITFVYKGMNTQFQANPLLNKTAEQRAAFGIGETVNSYWDYILLCMLIGSVIVIMITAWFVDTHSVFMVLYILGLVIGEIICAILSYIWYTVSNNASLNTVLNQFVITDHLLTYLPYYFAIIGCVAMVVTYAKENT